MSSTTLVADAILSRLASALGVVPIFQASAPQSITGIYVLCRISVTGGVDRRRRVDVGLDIYGRTDQLADVQSVTDLIDAALTGWTSAVDGFLGPFPTGTFQPVPQDQVDPEQVRVTGSFATLWVSLAKSN